MIRFLLLQNRQGKTRLRKWYIPFYDEAEKTKIEEEVHRMVVGRDRKYTNFIEFQSYKIIYRRYAGLFFTIGVDMNENELSCLESIHLFVELLDNYFNNVCELDIVFNFNKAIKSLSMLRACPLPALHPMPSPSTSQKQLSTAPPQVYSILDEFILSGEVQESSKPDILGRVKELERLD
ncbi:unnamed protein product [Chrysoparadoxa australica]